MTTTRPLVLALDLAALSGMAYGRAGERPRLSSRRLTGDSGQRGLALLSWLNNEFASIKPDHVFIEAPLSPAVMTDLKNTSAQAINLNGYVFLAMTVCAAHHIPNTLAYRQSVLSYFVGKARFPGRDKEAKRQVMARCRQLGWAPATEDEGDAAALWDYGCSQLSPGGMLNALAARPVKAGGRSKRPLPSEQEGLL